jgi:hypothetical protein
MRTTTKLWIALAILVVLTPLGLILPGVFGTETAWGEWSTEEVHKLVGFVPSKMAHLSQLWKAPLPDYALQGQENARLPALGGSYLLSAVVGVAVVALVTILLGRVLARRDKSDTA